MHAELEKKNEHNQSARGAAASPRYGANARGGGLPAVRGQCAGHVTLAYVATSFPPWHSIALYPRRPSRLTTSDMSAVHLHSFRVIGFWSSSKKTNKKSHADGCTRRTENRYSQVRRTERDGYHYDTLTS